MTITINVSPQQEKAIRQKASIANMTPEEYLIALATGTKRKRRAQSPASNRGRTWGEQTLAALEAEGVLGGYGDPSVDAPELARQLRKRFSNRTSE